MNRTPIIVPGQVYLNQAANEYLVVTKAVRGNIHFRGPGFSGMNEVERFLERFDPVNPEDLSIAEVESLTGMLNSPVPLLTGWVLTEDDVFDEEYA